MAPPCRMIDIARMDEDPLDTPTLEIWTKTPLAIRNSSARVTKVPTDGCCRHYRGCMLTEAGQEMSVGCMAGTSDWLASSVCRRRPATGWLKTCRHCSTSSCSVGHVGGHDVAGSRHFQSSPHRWGGWPSNDLYLEIHQLIKVSILYTCHWNIFTFTYLNAEENTLME